MAPTVRKSATACRANVVRLIFLCFLRLSRLGSFDDRLRPLRDQALPRARPIVTQTMLRVGAGFRCIDPYAPDLFRITPSLPPENVRFRAYSLSYPRWLEMAQSFWVCRESSTIATTADCKNFNAIFPPDLPSEPVVVPARAVPATAASGIPAGCSGCSDRHLRSEALSNIRMPALLPRL